MLRSCCPPGKVPKKQADTTQGGIKPIRVFPSADVFRMMVEFIQHDSTTEPCFSIVRIDLNCLIERVDHFSVPFVLIECVSAAIPRFGKVWPDGNCFGVSARSNFLPLIIAIIEFF